MLKIFLEDMLNKSELRGSDRRRRRYSSHGGIVDVDMLARKALSYASEVVVFWLVPGRAYRMVEKGEGCDLIS